MQTETNNINKISNIFESNTEKLDETIIPEINLDTSAFKPEELEKSLTELVNHDKKSLNLSNNLKPDQNDNLEEQKKKRRWSRKAPLDTGFKINTNNKMEKNTLNITENRFFMSKNFEELKKRNLSQVGSDNMPRSNSNLLTKTNFSSNCESMNANCVNNFSKGSKSFKKPNHIKICRVIENGRLIYKFLKPEERENRSNFKNKQNCRSARSFDISQNRYNPKSNPNKDDLLHDLEKWEAPYSAAELHIRMNKVRESQKQDKLNIPKIGVSNSLTFLDQLAAENKMLFGKNTPNTKTSRGIFPEIIINNNFMKKNHCGLDGNKKDVNINKNISDNSTESQTDSSRSTDEKIKLKLDFNEGFVFNKTFEKIIKFNKKLKKQGLYNSIKRDTDKNVVNNNEF